jgi:hypoxanthine phosphoribosyltransferase
MPELVPILEKDDIDKIVADVAHKISTDYQDKELILVCVLKGAFIFLSDLIRHLTIQVKVDFIGASSYGSGTSSSEEVKITKTIGIDICGKDVLIIEDIIDTGLTLDFIKAYLESFRPQSVKVCTLLNKKERRKTSVVIDYIGHEFEKGFLVGYGLDFDEKYRNLPDIYHLKF